MNSQLNEKEGENQLIDYIVRYKDGGRDSEISISGKDKEDALNKFYETFNGPDEMIWDVVINKDVPSPEIDKQERFEIVTWVEAVDADGIDQALISLYKEGSKFHTEFVYNNGEPPVIKELTEIRAFEMCITSGIIIHSNVLDEVFDKEMMLDYADSLRPKKQEINNEKRINNMNFTHLSESYSEQLNTFKQFVVDKSNLEKGDNKALEASLTSVLEKITDKDLKVITKQYAAESFKAGMFKSQDKILENSLKEFYIKINEHLTKDREFSIKIVNEPGVLKQIKMEAHTLNKGDLNYGNEIAAKEVSNYRSALIKADKQVRSLQDETSFLRGKVNRLNATITTILTNVKETFKIDNSDLKKLVVGNSKDIKLIADENLLKHKFSELQAIGVNSKNEIFEGVKINNGEELVWMKPDESTLKKVRGHIKITDEGAKFLTIVKGDTSQGKERGQSISR